MRKIETKIIEKSNTPEYIKFLEGVIKSKDKILKALLGKKEEPYIPSVTIRKGMIYKE
ncbi:unnamed protein product [marine sediment metagenome]|uniref:Uncharacterized protein n=1 Tax=marine sediment metagenome TaxID=412755 RepID=X1CYJ9_9ZZZZ